MAKRLFLFRHAQQVVQPGAGIWQPQAPLMEGAESRIDLAAKYMVQHGVVFETCWHSSLTRSAQTALVLQIRVSGNANVRLHEWLGPERIPEWEKLYEDWRLVQADPANPPDLQPADFVELFPELCKNEGQRLLFAINMIESQTKEGLSVAAVSHMPLINLAEWRATGVPPRPALDYCQALEFTFEAGQITNCKPHLF